jgi:hypothetical protein
VRTAQKRPHSSWFPPAAATVVTGEAKIFLMSIAHVSLRSGAMSFE